MNGMMSLLFVAAYAVLVVQFVRSRRADEPEISGPGGSIG
jgi:hypothetical protein